VTGLDYYVARYYDPVVGQFLSADVVQGNAQGMAPYAYVGGNPETKTDPTGQMLVCGNGCGLSGSGGGSQPQCSRGYELKEGQCARDHNGYQPPTAPCPNGGQYCEAKDSEGKPVFHKGKSALRESGVTDSDTVYGVGAFGFDRIITDLQQALLWLITQPLAALLNSNNAAQLSGIFGSVSTLAALASALIDLAGPAGPISKGLILGGTLLSAAFGAASGAANVASGEGPGSKQITDLQHYVNGIIKSLQDFAGALNPSVLNKMVFTLTEVDTYPITGIRWLSEDGGFGAPIERIPDGFTYDYNHIASAQFIISFGILS
jgi:hypothetical protein